MHIQFAASKIDDLGNGFLNYTLAINLRKTIFIVMRRILLCFLLFLSFTTDVVAAYVAVLETGADGDAKNNVSLTDRLFLTNVLREEAVKQLPAAQNFTILTRENILEMLPPGKTIEDCEGTCLVETAKNISADFICQARLGSFSGTMTLSAELYETAGNKLIASFNGRGTDLNELLQLIRVKSPFFFKSVREMVRSVPVPDSVQIPANVLTVEQERKNDKVGESLSANVDGDSAKKSSFGWVTLCIGATLTVTGVVLTAVGNSLAKQAAEKGGSSIDDLKRNRDEALTGQTLRGVGIGLIITGAIGAGLSFVF